MRSTGLMVSLLAAFCVSACTSSSGVDGLNPRPSSEVTSSIRPDAPVGPAATEEPIGLSLAEEQANQMDEGALDAVALVAPDKPTRAQKAIAGTIHRQKFKDAKPINFGKAHSPKNHAVHGVDVSRWQGKIDWVTLRSRGANFVYIKATDGGDHLDPKFKDNWRGAHEAGLKRGAYHFFYWCRVASEQADWFIRNVPKVKGALPPVIDVEWNGESSCKRRPSPEKVREKMQVFMDRLEAHYGQRPVIYTAPDFYRDNLKGAFPNHPFWLRAVAEHPSKVYPGRNWVFWQYSGSGLSQGVKGKIDLNAFRGDEANWHKWLAQVAG